MINISNLLDFQAQKVRHNNQHPKYCFFYLDNEERCIHSLEVYLWWKNENEDFLRVTCPKCKSENIKIVKRGKYDLYQCKCRKQFSVLSCTPFKSLKIDIFKIFHIYGYFSQRYPYSSYKIDPLSFDKKNKWQYKEVAKLTGVDFRTVKKVYGIFNKLDRVSYTEPDYDEDVVVNYSRRYIKYVKMKYRRYIRRYPDKLRQ